MNPAFHYIVRVKLIRFIKNDNIDFINDVLIFENKFSPSYKLIHHPI